MWDEDAVMVVGDVTVEDGVTLTVAPGVYIEFQGYYRLAVKGRLLACGTPDQWIRFTTNDPQGFKVDASHDACWNGIRFNETLETNGASRLAFCIIEYSKATTGSDGDHPYGGGAVSAIDFSKLEVANCILRHNVAEYGGALFLYRNASPVVTNNIIHDNHALENASAVYCAYCAPVITGNTIVRNLIHNQANPYIDTGAVQTFLAKPRLTNNILRDNDPEVTYIHTQVWEGKDDYIRFNNIQDWGDLTENIDADPLFIDPAGGDCHLTPASPCIDAGDNGAVGLQAVDTDGDPRIFPGDGIGAYPGGVYPDRVADIGADEYALMKHRGGTPKK